MDVYFLADGTEIHTEDRRRPAIIFPDLKLFFMGNNVGVVVGEAVVLPSPVQNPEMVDRSDDTRTRLKPEAEWPKPGAETVFVRGVAGKVVTCSRVTELYKERLRFLGIGVDKN